jgi:hypothetical protein
MKSGLFVLIVIVSLAASSYGQINSLSTDRIYLLSGKQLDGKLQAIKTDEVSFRESSLDVIYEFKNSEIFVILLSNGKYVFYNSPAQSTTEKDTVMPAVNDASKDTLRPASSTQTSPASQLAIIKLGGGISMPLGDFASTTSSYSGYAKTGLAFGLGLNYEVVHYFDIGLDGMFYLNSIDEAAYVDYFQRQGIPVSISTTSWLYYTVMGSAGFTVPASSSVRVYGHGRFGAILGQSPEIKLASTNAEVVQHSVSSTALAYGFDFGVQVSSKIDLALQYISSEPEANVTIMASNGYTSTTKRKQPMSVLSITIGYIF